MAAGQEAEWIRQIALGDEDAFRSLFRAYQRRLFGYLYGLTSRAETAEELTNDVLVEVWKSASRFRGDSRPSTWIFGIARHKALAALRKRDLEAENLEATNEQQAAAAADPAPRADEQLLREALQQSVREALARLSPAHREVIELTFYHGFSCQEIAAIANCPVNTVKTRMFHARRRLQEILEARGIKGVTG
jgi:RNA polymerase sigma-70 factor (ECF subfamily)